MIWRIGKDHADWVVGNYNFNWVVGGEKTRKDHLTPAVELISDLSHEIPQPTAVFFSY